MGDLIVRMRENAPIEFASVSSLDSHGGDTA
jgi:hypothetical protein